MGEQLEASPGSVGNSWKGKQLEGDRGDIFLLPQPFLLSARGIFPPCMSLAAERGMLPLTQTHKQGLNNYPIQRPQPLAHRHLFLPIANSHDFMADLTKIDVFLKGPVL